MLAWRKGFYGYVIAASAFLVYLFSGGSYYSLSVLTPLMAVDLNWSAAAFGTAFSIFALLSGVSSPIVGAFIVRHGSRLTIFIGSLLVAAALALLSTTNEIWQFYATIVVLGLGITLSVTLPIQQLVGNWFIIRRSLLLGLVATGGGFGGLIITSLAGALASASGSWRLTWLVLAGLMLVPALLATLLIRDRPEELGQKADGFTQEADLKAGAAGQGQTSRVYNSASQWETKAAVRTGAFWLLALANGVMFFLLQATTAHQVAYLAGERGMALTVAASALGLIAGASIFGRLVAGWLGGRVEPRIVMAGLLLLLGFSLVILVTGKGLLAVYTYVLLFGVGYGGMIVLGPATLLNYYGSRNYAAIRGISVPIGTVLGALSPLLVGSVKDVSGSYVPAFVLMIGLAVVGALCAFLARPPVPRAYVSLPSASSSV